MRKDFLKGTLVIILIFCMIAPGAVYAEEGSGVTDGNYGNIDYFQSVINMVKDKY